jgi:acetyl esterase/lipase
MFKSSSIVFLFLSICPALLAQQPDSLHQWTAIAASEFRTFPNLVYKRAGGYECKLDVVTAGERGRLRPTLIYFHGGGWYRGEKETTSLKGLPYLAQGMNFVNVEYRLAPDALAPAAVEDARCALYWISSHAKEYGIDVNKLVLSGISAGGHLALLTGMLTPEAGFDNECVDRENPELKVAAIVNFFGPTNVTALLEVSKPVWFVLRWFGSLPNKAELAKRLSPVTYVRKGLPPILTVHGDSDEYVPYDQAVQLHEALSRAGAPNQLHTVPGGKHAIFSREQTLKAYDAIFAFLRQNHILTE